jgi:hypothetical protein
VISADEQGWALFTNINIYFFLNAISFGLDGILIPPQHECGASIFIKTVAGACYIFFKKRIASFLNFVANMQSLINPGNLRR